MVSSPNRVAVWMLLPASPSHVPVIRTQVKPAPIRKYFILNAIFNVFQNRTDEIIDNLLSRTS